MLVVSIKYNKGGKNLEHIIAAEIHDIVVSFLISPKRTAYMQCSTAARKLITHSNFPLFGEHMINMIHIACLLAIENLQQI